MPKFNEKVLGGIYKRVVGAMSGLANINVEVHPSVQPHYDVKEGVIRMPSAVPWADNEEEDFNFGRGITVHEAGHVLFCPDYTEDFKKAEGYLGRDYAKDLHEWFNVFIDVNNEYKVTEVFPHLKSHLAAKSEALLKKHPEQLKTDNPFLQTLFRSDMVASINPSYPADYPKELQDFVDETVKEFKRLKLHDKEATKILKFSNEVNDKYQKLKEASKQQPANMPQLLQELGDAIKNGDSKREKELNDIIDNNAKAKRWFKDPIDRRILRESKGQGKFASMPLESVKKKVKKAEKFGVGGKEGAPPLTEKITRIYVEKGRGKLEDSHSAYREGKQVNRALKRKIMLENSFEKKHRSGSIDMEEIRKQIATCGRITKPTVFERRNNFQRGGEWALSVLIDVSGSMEGKNLIDAKQALGTLAYALDGLPNLHYELTGFSSHKDVQEVVIKKFN